MDKRAELRTMLKAGALILAVLAVSVLIVAGITRLVNHERQGDTLHTFATIRTATGWDEVELDHYEKDGNTYKLWTVNGDYLERHDTRCDISKVRD